MSIPTYYCLGKNQFRPRGDSDCSRDEARTIWGKSFTVGRTFRIKTPKNQPLIQKEVNKLFKNGVVVECEREDVKYNSLIFLREKTGGTQRLILKLKNLNKYPEYTSFLFQSGGCRSNLPIISLLCFCLTRAFLCSSFVVWVLSVYPFNVIWLRSTWAARVPFRYEFRFNVIGDL